MTEGKNKKQNTIKSSSLVYRLNAQLFFRMLSVFLTLDFILCLLFFLGLMNFEKAAVTELLESYSEDSIIAELFEGDDGLHSLGYEFAPKDGNAKIFSFDSNKPKVMEKIGSVNYHFSILASDGSEVYVTKDVGTTLVHFSGYLFILLIFELFMLFGSIGENKKTVREILKPLEELAKTTNAINSSLDMSPDYLKKIAGTLDSINASHLDTRLPVSAAKTELKSLSIAINGMLDRIDEAYKSQTRFISDASHELRTPISVIQGYADLLDRWGKEDPEAMQEAINAIKGESNSMKDMVEQLLFLARGDNQSMHFALEDIDVNALAKEVYSEVEMIDKVHHLECEFAPEDTGELMVISADRGLLKQLMRILIDNSLKYTKAGGSVKISTKRKDGNVIFLVQDEGVGIPSEALPFIFERFYRADESRARETGGTGLGLSIAKWIAEKHNGQLEVLSRQNIGSRFQVIIPAKE